MRGARICSRRLYLSPMGKPDLGLSNPEVVRDSVLRGVLGGKGEVPPQ